MTVLRWTAGLAGLALMAVGTIALLTGGHIRDPQDVALWLAAAITIHDGLLAPLVLAAGLLLRAAVRPVRGRRVVRGALMVAGCLTLVALPVLARPGPRSNPTVLPLNYVANWLSLLGITAAVAGLLLAMEHRRTRRRRATAHHAGGPPVSPPGRPSGSPGR